MDFLKLLVLMNMLVIVLWIFVFRCRVSLLFISIMYWLDLVRVKL